MIKNKMKNQMGLSNEQLLATKLIGKYKEVVMNMLIHSFPDMSKNEINKAVDYSIIKRMKNGKAVLDNNYKNVKLNTTLLQMAEYILDKEPIITAYGVYFKKSGTVPNPLKDMVTSFMEQRGIYKNKMFKAPKGSEEFAKYNLLQLLAKVDANALYGSIGMYSCLLYNIYVSPSITAQGQSLISSAGLFFESFLGCNFKFRSLDDIITFIDFIDKERPNRKYNDAQVLDRDITVPECFYRLMTNCGWEFIYVTDETTNEEDIRGVEYIPSEKDMKIILDILYDLDQETINRIYFKNNLYTFMEERVPKNAIIYLLKNLKAPMLDPNNAPEEIEVELEEFTKIIKEYVYYPEQWIDKTERYRGMTRVSNAHTDTDSKAL